MHSQEEGGRPGPQGGKGEKRPRSDESAPKPKAKAKVKSLPKPKGKPAPKATPKVEPAPPADSDAAGVATATAKTEAKVVMKRPSALRRPAAEPSGSGGPPPEGPDSDPNPELSQRFLFCFKNAH